MQVLHGPIRCEILVALAAGELDVSTLANALDLDVATVSHNLSKLRHRGLLVWRGEHKRRIYGHAPCVRAVVNDTHVEVTVTR